jgi:antitoxin (DNA-binding transcriptional repressor) of toxin-antitoxin stability system
MSTISLEDITRNPTSLLDRVQAGERFVVVRNGLAVAEFRPIPRTRETPRPFGLAASVSTVPDDFDVPLPDDILRGFEG